VHEQQYNRCEVPFNSWFLALPPRSLRDTHTGILVESSIY
jgi:hypothetical protein